MEAGSNSDGNDADVDRYVPPVIQVLGSTEETLGIVPSKPPGTGDEVFSGGEGDTLIL